MPTALNTLTGKMLVSLLHDGERLRVQQQGSMDGMCNCGNCYIIPRWSHAASCKRHPRDIGASRIETSLAHLAIENHVSSSPRNQAFSAIFFLSSEMQNS